MAACDCPWLSHDLEAYHMTVLWLLSLSHDYHMTITWLSYDHYRPSHHCCMTALTLVTLLPAATRLPPLQTTMVPTRCRVCASCRERVSELSSSSLVLQLEWSAVRCACEQKHVMLIEGRTLLHFTEWHQRLLIGRQMRLEKRPFSAVSIQTPGTKRFQNWLFPSFWHNISDHITEQQEGFQTWLFCLENLSGVLISKGQFCPIFHLREAP